MTLVGHVLARRAETAELKAAVAKKKPVASRQFDTLPDMRTSSPGDF
jgi:hypothetical protein